MKKLTYYLVALLMSATSITTADAQNNVQNNVHNPSLELDMPPSMTYPLDSMLNDWKTKNSMTFTQNCDNGTEVNPVFDEAVYKERMSQLNTAMEMPYNDIVRRCIDFYTGRIRGKVSAMLAVSDYYLPLFEQVLDEYNLPLELKYLPVIESALNPSIASRAGATGLWQFMLGTGKIYGLEINSLVDERKDPIKSTRAAARYLKDLYSIYGDWNLVIAAYNCGPGNVNKAVRRSGGKTDYWSIYPYLPRETRGYVPIFIAANYLMAHYRDHNICPMDVNMPANTDTIMISRKLHFQQIADLCGTDIERIKSLNPQYKRNIIPGGPHKSYVLRLPQENLSAFIDHQNIIYTHRAEELFNRSTVEAAGRKTAAASPRKKSSGKKGTTVTSSSSLASASSGGSGSGNASYHKIKTGETLSVIAKKYQVSVTELKQWNNLKNTRITAGKQLKVAN